MLQQQFELVLTSRNAIFDYIKTISNENFLSENSTFGRGSIRNLLVHISDTYCSWIGERALGINQHYLPFQHYKNLDDCIRYFDQANDYIFQFMDLFQSDMLREMEIRRNEMPLKTNPLTLFTHVITHEFHHKGQIMSLSRHLGYIPADVDIIR